MKNIKGIYLGYAENLEPQSRAFEEVGDTIIVQAPKGEIEYEVESILYK